MQLYQPTVTGSLSISGSINLSGSLTLAGGGTISGTASIATNAITASSADNFLVRNTLTAQTLVVQTITSSVDFVTGSTRFGSIAANTHVFTGSMSVSGSGLFTGTLTAASATTTGRVEFGTNSLKGIMDYSAGTGLWYLHNQSAGAASVDYFQFQADGTNVLNIKKSGASTFLNTLQINQSGSEIQQVINSNSNSNPSVTQYKVNNSSGWEVGMSNLANSYSYLFSYGSFGTGNAKFTLTSAGAGTFASSLRVGGATGNFIVDTYTTSKIGVRSWTDTTGTTNNFFIQNSANFNYGVVGVASATGTSTGDVYALGYTPSAGTSMTPVINWTSAGKVGIGNSLGYNALDVKGAGTSTTSLEAIAGFYKATAKGGALLISAHDTVADIAATWYNGATDMALSFTTVPSSGIYTERMRITSGGKVVINDTFMDGLFGINTKSSVAYSPSGYNGGNANIRLSNGSAGVGRYTGIAFGGGGSTEGFFGVVQNSSELADMVWQTFNGSAYGEKMRMYSGGALQIYNLAGGGTRTVTADASGILAASSDSSLKQEDTTHQIEGLTEILQLQPRAYKWLSDIERRGEEATTEIGFFADEVAPLIPSAAPKNHDGLYGFYDRAVIAALVKGMQELKAEFDAYKTTHP